MYYYQKSNIPPVTVTVPLVGHSTPFSPKKPYLPSRNVPMLDPEYAQKTVHSNLKQDYLPVRSSTPAPVPPPPFSSSRSPNNDEERIVLSGEHRLDRAGLISGQPTGRYGVSYIGGGTLREPNRWLNLWANPGRPKQQKGTCFVTAVSVFLCFEYLSYLVTILPSVIYPEISIIGICYAVFFHILFIFLIISFIQTSITDPGVVPSNWGFYMGDDCKRRRYCKVCHLWKPDRTHHCSACGRCVLNMDHHCPWVNNCIGFQNRKFFIQLLGYGILCVLCVVCHTTYYILIYGTDLLPRCSPQEDLFQYLIDITNFGAAVIMLLLAVMLGIPLIPFTKFHITMIIRNSSTIENMDPDVRNRSRYDLGTIRNLEQVMGSNCWLWWLPCHNKMSRPVGDGVRWRQKYWKAVEADMVEASRQGNG